MMALTSATVKLARLLLSRVMPAMMAWVANSEIGDRFRTGAVHGQFSRFCCPTAAGVVLPLAWTIRLLPSDVPGGGLSVQLPLESVVVCAIALPTGAPLLSMLKRSTLAPGTAVSPSEDCAKALGSTLASMRWNRLRCSSRAKLAAGALTEPWSARPCPPGSVVEVVVLGGKQVPLMLGFCCLQSFTKRWQAFRCVAFIFRQAFFSAFVPVHDLLFGTSARQFLTSCLQSLRQWLGMAAPTIPGTAKLASATKTNVPVDRFLMCRLLGGGCLRLHERIAMAVPVGLISARIDSGLNPAERRASWRPPPATLGSPRTREHAASIYGRGYSP